MGKPIVAIIPAKGISRRVPGKNMRLFNEKPLIYYTIVEALKSKMIDEVYVSTESADIQSYAKSCGAKVPFLRQVELCGDNIHGVVPIIDMLQKLGGVEKYSYCVQLLASHPLKKSRTIDEVVRLSTHKKANVLSVTPFGKTLYHLRNISEDGTLQRVTKDVVHNIQTQDGPEMFYLNGAIYCVPVSELIKNKTYQYGNPYGVVMSQIEAFDIDTETDFLMAEKLASLVELGALHGR